MSILGTAAGFVASMFSSNKLQDTAIDGIRKLGGLDEMNDKEKADWLLQYIDKTKHQSIMRRFIAFMFVVGFMVFTGSWLICTVLFRVGMGLGWSPALMGQLDMLSDDIMAMTETVLLNPVNIVIGFYFAVDMIKRK